MENLNIMIATHGQFGRELIRSAEMIVGKMPQVTSLSLLPEKSFEAFMQEADQALASLEGPIVALVDLYGGTPCNVLTALTKKYPLHVVTGLNLPVLIDLYLKNQTTDREWTCAEIAAECQKTIRESAVYTNEQL